MQHVLICAGDAAKMRVNAEQLLEQVVQQRSEFEEKLAEMERNASLMLNNAKQIHREQLETEQHKKVMWGLIVFLALENTLKM